MVFEVRIDRKEDIAALDYQRTQKALDERRELLAKVFEEAGESIDFSKVTVIEAKDGHSLAGQISAMNDELTAVGEHYETLRKVHDAKSNLERLQGKSWAPPTGDKPRKQRDQKSIGELFIAAGGVDIGKAKASGRVDIDLEFEAMGKMLGLKTIMSTSAGWAPETTRIGRVVLDEQRPVEVIDNIPVYQTGQSAVVFMEETTFTNAAAERAEGGAYAEAALALTERSETVRSIGVSLPITDEQIADEPMIRDYIDGRLLFMTRQRLDSQVLVGDGNAPNLRGTLNVSGINTQAKGADSVPDAVYKGIVAAQVTGRAQPDLAIFHPNDWQDVRLLKTADGIYIWGSPADAGPQRIWGLPVISTTAVTQNTAIVGDYARHAGLFMRQGVEVQVGYVNDDFTDGRVTFRAGLRAAMVHFRPSAFTQVTGI